VLSFAHLREIFACASAKWRLLSRAGVWPIQAALWLGSEVNARQDRCPNDWKRVCVCYPWKRKEASIGVLYLPASDAKDDLVSITMR